MSVPEILVSNTANVNSLLKAYFKEFLAFTSENETHVIHEPVEVFLDKILGEGQCGKVYKGTEPKIFVLRSQRYLQRPTHCCQDNHGSIPEGNPNLRRNF